MTNTRTSTWANIGTTLNENNIDDVLVKAGLDYTVTANPLYTTLNDKQIEVKSNRVIIKDNGDVCGVVSNKYVPMQNKDAFDFIHYINEDIKFVKAGETKTGLVYVIGELHEMNILGDAFKTHLIFQNSHNGKYQLAMSICPLRIICSNQFNLSFKKSNATYLIRHTKNVESRMAIASETLHKISDYMSSFKEKAELFAKQKVDSTQVTKFLNYMFPEKEGMTEKAIIKLEDEKAKFLRAYNAEDNQNFKGSAWGLLNGLTDYITHKEFKRKVELPDEKRFIETIVVANNLNSSMEYLQSLTV